MGSLGFLRGSIVCLDTTPLIYFTEKNPTYFEATHPFFEAITHSEFTAITSIMTLLEVLVHPIRQNDVKLIQRYRDLLFDTEGLKTVFLSREIAEEAARLRTFHNIRTPDSIQIATALKEGASFFLTNDMRLPSLPGLQTLVLDELIKDSDEQKKDQ